eukprot:9354767-Alexandrium_andersonii.AAC.1
MATVAHPNSVRSPWWSGEDQTTAAPPPTEYVPTRLAAPSNVTSAPRGASRGANPLESATRTSSRAASGTSAASRARDVPHSRQRERDHEEFLCPSGATLGGGRHPTPWVGHGSPRSPP